ncbi:MAG: TolB family protein [Candidatus Zhuqueibacterota bacterium]
MLKKSILFFILLLFAHPAFSDIPFKARGTATISEAGQFLSAPKWSPDGKYIAAAGDNFGSIWLYNVQANSWIKLVEQNGAGWEFDWSPDSRRIAFRANKMDGRRKLTTILVVDIVTGQTQQLADFDRDFSTPRWVNAVEVAFLHHDALQVAALPTISLSKPDSTSRPRSICLFSAKGVLTKEMDKTLSQIKPLEGRVFNVSYSPDNSRILFKQQGRAICVMNKDGKNIQRIAEGEMPVWNPSGEFVAYSETREDAFEYTSSDLWIVTANGAEKQQITFTKDEMEMRPHWSPDGRRIACDSNGKIILIDLVGREQ